MTTTKTFLLRAQSEVHDALGYLNRHEIVRAYRATERTLTEIERALEAVEAEK